jgi:hypothetical protein
MNDISKKFNNVNMSNEYINEVNIDQPETILVDILNEKHKLLINVSECDKIDT